MADVGAPTMAEADDDTARGAVGVDDRVTERHAGASQIAEDGHRRFGGQNRPTGLHGLPRVVQPTFSEAAVSVCSP